MTTYKLRVSYSGSQSYYSCVATVRAEDAFSATMHAMEKILAPGEEIGESVKPSKVTVL